MSDPYKIELETRHRLPGGEMVILLTCLFPGTVPSAFIVSEPDEATAERTALRDQVALLNALRQIARPRYLELIVTADKACHGLLLPALNLMTVPPAKRQEAAA